MSSPTKPTTSIDDLPWEMISELFEHLNPKDLAACSRVNKRWHSVFAALKVHRLVALDHLKDCPLEWNYPALKIEDKAFCHLNVFNGLVDQPLVSNLKHLTLCGESSTEFDLNRLNQFNHLVHLEIYIKRLSRKKANFNFPKLKVLVFGKFNCSCSLSIDCPQLSVLVCRGEYETANLDVKYPETIRKLETKMLGQELVRFKNVECLVTSRFNAIRKTTLLSLPKLKELHYNASIEYLIDSKFGNAVRPLDRMKRTLRKFMNYLKVLRGPDFKFRFSGFQLTEVKLEQIDFGVEVGEEGEDLLQGDYDEYLYMKNYQLIDPDVILDFIRAFRYDLLMSYGNGEIPSCFFKKFPAINRILVFGEIKSEGYFVWFLKQLKTLRKLDLTDPELSQEFYDQLPEACPSLLRLDLCTNENENGLQLNLLFIGKLSHLSELDLKIHQSLPIESLTWLIRHLAKLKSGYFNFPMIGKNFEVYNYSKVWRVLDFGRRLFQTENIEEIANFFERLHSDTPKAN